MLTTPVLRCLRTKFPDAQIDYLTKKEFLPVIEENPHVNQVFTINDQVMEVIGDLRKEHYDYIVDLHKNYRSALVKSKLGRPSGTFNKLNVKKWLLVNAKIRKLPNIHIVDRLSLINSIEVSVEVRLPRKRGRLTSTELLVIYKF